MSRAVVVFGKSATPGNVKTRLSPPLTPKQAATMYDAFARDVMETVARYCEEVQEEGDKAGDIRRVLAWDGDSTDALAEFASQKMGFELIDQGTGDLGDRLRRVVKGLRADGARQILVVGTDSPTLSVEHLKTASLLVESNDVVFGPSFDGGYYLVAVGESRGIGAEEVIFDDIPWSTSGVLEVSWRRAVDDGLLCDLLGFWYDIDTCEDLAKARFHLCEYLGSRDPLVGQNTRHLFETNFIDIDEIPTRS